MTPPGKAPPRKRTKEEAQPSKPQRVQAVSREESEEEEEEEEEVLSPEEHQRQTHDIFFAYFSEQIIIFTKWINN